MVDNIEEAGTQGALGGEFTTLTDLINVGGPVVSLLLVMSVIALAIIFLKLWQFSPVLFSSDKFVGLSLNHWRDGNSEAALQQVQTLNHPVAKVITVAIHGQQQPEISDSLVREEAARVAGVELEKLRGNLRGLELIGSLSPLLGLLGTVMGMITAFQQLQVAGANVDPGVLSGGIWEALLTTAVGLVVAIPAVAALSGFERVIERIKHNMEDALTQVFTHQLTIIEPAHAPKAAQICKAEG